MISKRAWSQKGGSRPRLTVQSLGEFTYAIPEVARESTSLLTRCIQFAMVLFFPISFSLFTVFTGIMTAGPKSWRMAIISRMIPMMMKRMKSKTLNQRKLLLQHLKGRVLDVGSGGGAYFSLFKDKASHVVALEPVSKMHDTIRYEAQKACFHDFQITISTQTVEEYASSHPTEKFDWVILGNVLCEVENQKSTLEAISRLLLEGGHVYFSEHLAAHPSTFTRNFQNFINPWWRRVSGGCNCNRDSLHALEEMADWDVISWQMNNLKVFSVPIVMGLARKVTA
jgi:SAM-dependent methyltransferase